MSKPTFQRIEELFNKAVALPADKRAAFLDEVCQGDLELRQAVEALLRHDDGDANAATFRASPVTQLADFARLNVAPPPLPRVPGYEILRELGRGGMGVVYLARHLGLNRLVGLKMLPTAQATADGLARFRTEAQTLARLQHPNVVPIYDVGEFEGHPYFTMEYIAGPSLAELLDGRPQDVIASTSLLEALARAVHAVHQAGIVHRDLKPANILGVGGPTLTQFSASTPKITDFGLAKDLTSPRHLTQTGTLMGTPSYMAPEQVRNDADRVGPAVDIYALGSILYEMLTGRPPFDGQTPAETIDQLLHEEPPAPARLRPMLPADLVTICLKCLEKSSRQRYASALDLAEDLRRYQAGEPILARPIGLLGRAYRQSRRHPLVAALVALSTVLAIAFVVTLVVYNALLSAKVEAEQRQIVQLNVTIGIKHMEQGDTFAAVLHFSEALRLEEDATRIADHRVRIAAALRSCPRLMEMRRPRGQVICSTLDSRQSLVATAGPDHAIEVWDPWTGAKRGQLRGQDERSISGALSSDGRVLATLGASGKVYIWDIATGTQRALPVEETKAVKRLAISKAGRYLLALNASGAAEVWDLEPAVPVHFRPGGGDSRLCTLSENGRWLFMVDRGGMGQLWDMDAGKAVSPPWPMKHDVTAAAVNGDGRRLALFAPDYGLLVVDALTGAALNNPVRLRETVSHVGFGPRDESIFAVGSDHELHLLQVESGVEFDLSPQDGGPITFAAPDASRCFLVVGNGVGARVWDAKTGLAATPLLRHGGACAAATFADDGRRLVTVSQDGLVCIWELPEPAPEVESVAPEQTTTVLAPLSIDLENGTKVRVEKAQFHGELRSPRSADGMVDRVVFSPDGRLVVVATVDNTAQIWDASAGKRASPPLHHVAAVVWAAFSPDSRRLLTASADGTARLWNVETGEPLAPATRLARPIQDVFFRDTGKQVIVVFQGRAATLDLSPDEHAASEVRALAQLLACQRINDRQQEETLAEGDVLKLWESQHPGQ